MVGRQILTYKICFEECKSWSVERLLCVKASAQKTSKRKSVCVCILTEGSLEIILPTTWTDEKQRWEEPGKRREEERRSKKRKPQKKEDPGARKGRKVALRSQLAR